MLSSQHGEANEESGERLAQAREPRCGDVGSAGERRQETPGVEGEGDRARDKGGGAVGVTRKRRWRPLGVRAHARGRPAVGARVRVRFQEGLSWPPAG